MAYLVRPVAYMLQTDVSVSPIDDLCARCKEREAYMGMTSHVTRTVHVKPSIAMNENRRCG